MEEKDTYYYGELNNFNIDVHVKNEVIDNDNYIKIITTVNGKEKSSIIDVKSFYKENKKSNSWINSPKFNINEAIKCGINQSLNDFLYEKIL